MHSSITPARIPPVMTIVPADIRPAPHQTLQRWQYRERHVWTMQTIRIWYINMKRNKCQWDFSSPTFNAKCSVYLHPMYHHVEITSHVALKCKFCKWHMLKLACYHTAVIKLMGCLKPHGYRWEIMWGIFVCCWVITKLQNSVNALWQ